MTGGRGRKLLDPLTLKNATNEVANLADAQNVKVALLGGFALYLYGSDRLTGDIDVVSDARIDGLPPGSQLSFGGEATETSGGVPVDVILRSDEYVDLYEQALVHAVDIGQTERVNTDSSVVPGIRIVSPEYLVAMKMAANRTKDWADLEFMIEHQMFDRNMAFAIVHTHLGRYAVTELRQLIAEVEWKKGRQ